MQWDGLMQYGNVDDEDINKELQKRMDAQAANRGCLLIYTVCIALWCLLTSMTHWTVFCCQLPVSDDWYQ